MAVENVRLIRAVGSTAGGGAGDVFAGRLAAADHAEVPHAAVDARAARLYRAQLVLDGGDAGIQGRGRSSRGLSRAALRASIGRETAARTWARGQRRVNTAGSLCACLPAVGHGSVKVAAARAVGHGGALSVHKCGARTRFDFEVWVANGAVAADAIAGVGRISQGVLQSTGTGGVRRAQTVTDGRGASRLVLEARLADGQVAADGV